MLTLAIDTATKVCTVALCREQELLAEYTINMGMTHSEGLLPQLEHDGQNPVPRAGRQHFHGHDPHGVHRPPDETGRP